MQEALSAHKLSWVWLSVLDGLFPVGSSLTAGGEVGASQHEELDTSF